MCFRLLLPPFVIIFDIIPRSVGVSENVFSFTPPSLRNYSKFAAEIWRKDQEILFLFGILYFKVNNMRETALMKIRAVFLIIFL